MFMEDQGEKYTDIREIVVVTAHERPITIIENLDQSSCDLSWEWRDKIEGYGERKILSYSLFITPGKGKNELVPNKNSIKSSGF